MRIVILTQWFLPEPRRMFLEMAQELQNKGHEVQVVTGFPNWPGGKVYPGYKIRLYQREVMDGVDVLRLPIYPDHSHSKIKRILNLSTLGFSFLVLGPWLVKKADLIHVVQLPTLCVSARLVGLLWRAPFTLEVQDIWPESLSATGMMTSRRLLALVTSLCNWTYRKAARIRVISAGSRKNLVGKGVPAEKITVIHNCIDTDYFRPVEPDQEKAKQLGLDGKFNILYAGSLGLPQQLETALGAAELLRDLPDVQFVFAGGGVDEDNLKAIAHEKSLSNVKFLGSFPGNEMPQLYALADVLLTHLLKDPLFYITIPSKLVSHLAVGKPNLNAVEGDAAELVEEAGAGISCASQDPEAMATAVRRLFAMPKDELAAMGQRGRKAACERYSRTILREEFDVMVRQAVESVK